MNLNNFPVINFDAEKQIKVILVPEVGGLNVWGDTPEEIIVRIEEMKIFLEELAQSRAERGAPTYEETEEDLLREEADHREWLEQLAEREMEEEAGIMEYSDAEWFDMLTETTR